MSGQGSRVVCTLASGPHLELFDVTAPALARYAERFGYEFVPVHERLDRGRPAAWDKVVLLHSLARKHDLVVWVDADALVLDRAPDIATALSDRRPVHLVEHRSGRGCIPNTGVLALRGGARTQRFLEAVWNERAFVHDRWWENAAVNHLLGYRDFPYLGVRPVVPSRWRLAVGRLDRAWNSIPEDAAPDPYIVHFPGVALDVRLRELERAAAA
jgi:hypothetical protein